MFVRSNILLSKFFGFKLTQTRINFDFYSTTYENSTTTLIIKITVNRLKKLPDMYMYPTAYIIPYFPGPMTDLHLLESESSLDFQCMYKRTLRIHNQLVFNYATAYFYTEKAVPLTPLVDNGHTKNFLVPIPKSKPTWSQVFFATYGQFS